jgi:histidyl-tRNA synthetase
MFWRVSCRKNNRQFHQVGAEVFGAAGPDIDAELLAMCQLVWKELGIDGLRLEINSLGTASERQRYREVLRAYFSARLELLDDDSVRRGVTLRIMDSKAPSITTDPWRHV